MNQCVVRPHILTPLSLKIYDESRISRYISRYQPIVSVPFNRLGLYQYLRIRENEVHVNN